MEANNKLMEANMVTQKQLDNKKEQLAQARTLEASITDKYSTNYVLWNKACDKVNRLKRDYNKLATTWNFEHGSVGISAVVV